MAAPTVAKRTDDGAPECRRPGFQNRESCAASPAAAPKLVASPWLRLGKPQHRDSHKSETPSSEVGAVTSEDGVDEQLGGSKGAINSDGLERRSHADGGADGVRVECCLDPVGPTEGHLLDVGVHEERS